MKAKSQARLNVFEFEPRDVPSASQDLFDAKYYLQRYADVRAAVQQGQLPSAEDHFRRFGEAEGRVGNPLFNAQEYLDDNPDVKAAVQNGRITAFTHFAPTP